MTVGGVAIRLLADGELWLWLELLFGDCVSLLFVSVGGEFSASENPES